MPELKEDGSIEIEGQNIGKLEGFRFFRNLGSTPDDRLPVAAVGGAVGAAYAITLATGRYDDLVGELYRIATNA